MKEFNQPKNDGCWRYNDVHGDPILYVIRKNYPDKPKQFHPYLYRKDRWKMGLDDDYQYLIYGLDLIEKNKALPILIVEGEKTCEAARKLFPDYLCLTWHGGTSTVLKADWSHIYNRKVWLWPDNDKRGKDAMKSLAEALSIEGCEVHLINIDGFGLNKKWDLANYNPHEGQIDFDFLKMNMEDTRVYSSSKRLIDVYTFPALTSKSKPTNDVENTEHLINFYNIDVKYNIIRKEIEVHLPFIFFCKSNHHKLVLSQLKLLHLRNHVPHVELIEWLGLIADKNQYNPVKNYIFSKKWDGQSRLAEFFNTLTCENTKLRDTLLKRWMIGAVAMGMADKERSHPGALTLLGPQYCGKSSWFKSLVPDQQDLTLGDYSLDPTNKDHIKTATKYWLTELSEVDGIIRKSDASAMKSFITRSTDVYRSPYDRADTEAYRTTAFVATVNDRQFLKDKTGNRRWWVIEITKANAEHGIDMQQVWAEIYHLYKNGDTYFLSNEEHEMLMQNNEDHMIHSPIEDLIKERYQWHSDLRDKYKSIMQILSECGIDLKGGNKGEEMKECHRVLRKLTNSDGSIIKGVKKYKMPFIDSLFQLT